MFPIAAVPDFDRQYVGSLGGRLPIHMTLHRKGDQLTGTYRYDRKSKESLSLRGKVGQAGTFTLVETFGRKAVTGRFQGTIGDDGTLRGVWSRPDGQRSMPFLLKREEVAPATLPSPWEGTWSRVYGVDTSFSVVLRREGERITGWYLVRGAQGKRDGAAWMIRGDATPSGAANLTGTLRGDEATVGFRSGLGGSGTARLSLRNGRLEWRILNDRGDSLLPRRAELTRERSAAPDF